MFAALIAAHAFAAPAPIDPLSQIVVVGVNNAFGVKAQKLALNISDDNRLNAYSALLPTLTLAAQRQLQGGQAVNTASNATYSESDASTMAVAANWTLWNGYQNVRNVEIGNNNYKFTREQSRTQVQTFIVQLIGAFLTYEQDLANIQIQSKVVQQSRETSEESQILVKAGAKTTLDAMDTEIQLANDENILRDDEIQMATDQRTLQALLSVDKPVELPGLDLVSFQPYFAADFEAKVGLLKDNWQNEFDHNQPDLKTARIQLDTAMMALQQTKLSFFPVTTIGVSHTFTLDSYVNNNPPAGTQPLQSNAITLNLTWQFWDWLQTPRNVDIAQKTYDTTILSYRQNDLNLRATFASALQQIYELKKTIETSRQIEAKAVQQLEYSREKYRMGRISLLQMQQSTTRLSTARVNLANRLVTYYKSAATLLYNLGYDLSPPGSDLSWIK